MKNSILLILIFFVSLFGFGQNPGVLYLTEFSNGSDYSKEYIEFVIGGDGDCGDYVDVRGWIIDDNNGDFGTSGISTGFIKLDSIPFWENVKIGTVVVLFNNNDVNIEINNIYSNYSKNTDNDLIIQTQYNDSYFISINNSDKVSGTWTSVALNNSSDVVQIKWLGQ